VCVCVCECFDEVDEVSKIPTLIKIAAFEFKQK